MDKSLTWIGNVRSCQKLLANPFLDGAVIKVAFKTSHSLPMTRHLDNHSRQRQ
jgi:hypothetical protein